MSPIICIFARKKQHVGIHKANSVACVARGLYCFFAEKQFTQACTFSVEFFAQ